MKRVMLAVWMMVGVGGVWARGGEISVIPRPETLVQGTGEFVLDGKTRIIAEAGIGEKLAGMLRPATGLELKVVRGPQEMVPDPKNVILISIYPHADWKLGSEGYRLKVTADSVTIEATTEAGAFYGMQTLRQLFPVEIFGDGTPKDLARWAVPAVTIEDRPRFAWRGMMLDCSRHFFPKEFVERFIDVMAIHKFNRFHWHLTDDQGWRIQIMAYPKLTAVGGWRNQTVMGHEAQSGDKFDGTRYGGFYTQDDVREIVKYAAERYVTVVPEIEMPGHSTAAIAAYPELGCEEKPVEVGQHWGVYRSILKPTDHTIHFYQDVLTEVMGLFPGPYIHLGGDEVPLDEWKGNAEIGAEERRLGLSSDLDMEHYFISEMGKFVASKGRHVVGWDDVLDAGVPAGTVVMSWHGTAPAIKAAEMGDDAIMTPSKETYFDHFETKNSKGEGLGIGGYVPLSGTYGFDPVAGDLTEEGKGHILGAQGQVWTEYITSPQRVEYMAFPRECALAEVDWSPAQGKDYGDFTHRLAVHMQRLDELKVGYRHPKEGD